MNKTSISPEQSSEGYEADNSKKKKKKKSLNYRVIVWLDYGRSMELEDHREMHLA